jgi:hypothetical protein
LIFLNTGWILAAIVRSQARGVNGGIDPSRSSGTFTFGWLDPLAHPVIRGNSNSNIQWSFHLADLRHIDQQGNAVFKNVGDYGEKRNREMVWKRDFYVD